MATPTMAIHRIRRARRQQAPPSSPHFDTYRAAYRRILDEMDECLGESGVDEVTEWIIDRTRETGDLPDPESVRELAREVCARNDITLSSESVLERPIEER